MQGSGWKVIQQVIPGSSSWQVIEDFCLIGCSRVVGMEEQGEGKARSAENLQFASESEGRNHSVTEGDEGYKDSFRKGSGELARS